MHFPDSRTWRDLAIVLAVAASSWLAYGHAGQPILGDRAYHVYMAQAVLRGEALYGETTYGYTPYAPLLSALAMRVSAPFGVPTYLAPRGLGFVVLLLLALLLYFVARRAAGERVALIAAITLAAFAHLSILSAVGTEPVALVALFTLLSIHALQRRRWITAGFAACAAALTWQPAVVVCLGALVLALLGDDARRRIRPALLLLAGAVLAAIPAVVYILTTGTVDDFVYQAVARKWAYDKDTAGASPFSWPWMAFRAYWTEGFVLLSAALGLIVQSVILSRRHAPTGEEHGGEGPSNGQPSSSWSEGRSFAAVLFARGGLPAAQDDRSGDLPILAITLAWIAWFTLDFAAAKDLVPALPLIAYWSARAITALASPGRRSLRYAVLSFYFLILFLDAALYRPGYTLAAQRRDVETLLGPSRENFIAFGAEDFYVLTETRAPIRYLRLGAWVDAFIDAREPGGVAGFPRRIAALRPAAIIIRDVGDPNRAQTALEASLHRHSRTVLRTPYNYPIANIYRHVRPQWPATTVYRPTAPRKSVSARLEVVRCRLSVIRHFPLRTALEASVS